jgi:Na+/H+ antiporter NhaA
LSASADSTLDGPAAPVDQTRPKRRILLGQVAAPVRAYLVTEAGSAGLLLAATVAALLWANSPWSDSYTSLWHTELGIRIGDWERVHDLQDWVNDGLMVLFFFVVGLEVRREISVGELQDRRRLIVPSLGALFGLVVPAALFLAVNPSGDAAHGWGVAIGTDTAFVLGVLALVGPSCPTQLRVFLLTLSIADDVLAVSVIGIFYSESIHVGWLVAALACLAGIALLSRLHAWRAAVFVAGLIVLWLCTIESGLHPTIAGMAAGLAVTAYPPRRDVVERAARGFRAFRQSPLPSVGRSAQLELVRAVSVNERLQAALHPWTSFVIVPLFALANAGVDLRGGLLGDALTSPLTWGIVLGLVVGKLVGIGAASLGAVRLGLGPLPQGVGSGQVVAGAALCGIGFTVSLLIADLAFERPEERDQAIVGVLLAGVLASVLGWVLFELAARLRGERTAGLPLVLDRPVDPERDHVRFGPAAPMTLVEYGDFECPFCGKATGVVRELYERFGDDLRYVFRHLPLQDVHEHAELAAQAAEAAGAQGRFWEYHDLLFHHQEQLEWEDLLGYAAELDLDVERFAREIAEGVHAARVRADVASAEASGARGTPTFFVGERRHLGAYDAATLARELEASRAPTPVS